MSIFNKSLEWLEKKPLVLLRFEEGFEDSVRESRRGLSRFTFARPHYVFDGIKLPTLCLVEMLSPGAIHHYVGVVTVKAAVTTFDSRLTVIELKTLQLPSLNDLATSLSKSAFQTSFRQRLEKHRTAAALSPQLSVAIIEALSKNPDNLKAIEAAARHVPKLREVSPAEWGQLDAIRTALAAFGLSKSHFPNSVEIPEGSDSALNHFDPREAYVVEDNVIAKDASVLPGFDLVEKHLTGRAVFTKGEQKLEVYTANRGPLEKMLGVDLIYINQSIGNAVMLQYKMLEPYVDPVSTKRDWICRVDSQFLQEKARMQIPVIAKKFDDYRCAPNPFYFKFVRRTGGGDSHKSFIISLDHLSHLLPTARCQGPKGGLRISFDSLEGTYLREENFVGLIQSGYFGTHRLESEVLHPLIKAVSEGNRALVLAWQKRIENLRGSDEDITDPLE